MTPFLVTPRSFIKGKIRLPADKSITHRAVILGALSKGPTIVNHYAQGKDCNYTIQLFKKLGIKITQNKSRLIVYGKGLNGLKPSKDAIFIGDSGTTIRILLGVLAGQEFSTCLRAGKYLSRRPMKRVTVPLRKMGADIKSSKRRIEEYPPITIKGGSLKPIVYRVPVASAQVKSAILFAGLYTKGVTKVIELIRTRDHTERMLKLFKADVKTKGKVITIKGGKGLKSCPSINIPGDISSASFFIAAALIAKNSLLVIEGVGLNPGRSGIIQVFKRMRANIKIKQTGKVRKNSEPYGDIIVKTSQLKATRIRKSEIPTLIDELPILMVAACFAKGETIIESVQELRHKETDRIHSMVNGLSKMGADIEVRAKAGSEDIIINGPSMLTGAKVRSFGDHRSAMSLIIAGINAQSKTYLDDVECISKSFPDFLQVLKAVTYA